MYIKKIDINNAKLSVKKIPVDVGGRMEVLDTELLEIYFSCDEKFNDYLYKAPNEILLGAYCFSGCELIFKNEKMKHCWVKYVEYKEYTLHQYRKDKIKKILNRNDEFKRFKQFNTGEKR